ncbi:MULTISPECIES: FadR/GntR family transcriptional regulator [unclassified Rhodococcus (in: high G+C Gram-positive bacteria)]|uniref:FadR/GntR family transcriptional regulator n=1 Tax=unclassified Rhodococcus (in: high G+C Gram-positive bacteria) TaxID=192944 RepID=UPI000701A7BD|nr:MULTISPECIES: FCD domain-containing protein [unclassified Rhodococcus (in: high G+C Gram-positive bacteria)]KQU28549.1 hypothetical protein ASG69_11175 [Rhodococcus sp. Leaf225]KQU47535.1 hypothetical protein ASH03_21805 [Rhodococcus sp. Leaf258]
MYSDISAVSVSRVEALARSLEASLPGRNLAPGDRLTTVADLREQTGLAKQTITEALRLLAERGLVEIRPGRNGGVFVARPSPVVRLRQTLLAVPNDSATVADAMAVRDALEDLICRDAARCRTARDIAALRRSVERMADSVGSTDTFMAANLALHERIAAITPNAVAKAVYLGSVSCIRDLSTSVTAAEGRAPDYLERRVRVHADLIEAIAAGDAETTAAAVRRHNAADVED